jgi:uncharacterized membrane protein
LTVGLVPFTTNLIAESGGTIATMIYAAAMVVSGLSLAGIWQYAVVNKLIDPRITREEQREHLQATLLTSLVFAISIPLSVAHADGAKYFWIALWPAGVALRWWSRYRWNKEHPGVPYPRHMRGGGGETETP